MTPELFKEWAEAIGEVAVGVLIFGLAAWWIFTTMRDLP